MSQMQPGMGSDDVRRIGGFEKSNVVQAAEPGVLFGQSPGFRHLGCMGPPSRQSQWAGDGSWVASSEQQL